MVLIPLSASSLQCTGAYANACLLQQLQLWTPIRCFTYPPCYYGADASLSYTPRLTFFLWLRFMVPAEALVAKRLDLLAFVEYRLATISKSPSIRKSLPTEAHLYLLLLNPACCLLCWLRPNAISLSQLLLASDAPTHWNWKTYKRKSYIDGHRL